MGQYTSYYLYQKYESRGGQDPIPCSPSIYSIDADGTMQKVIKLDNDPDCGYTPSPTEPIYRWYQIPITEDYICANCPSGTTIERWINSGTTCSEGDLYNLQVKQISYDGGSTWQNTSETQLGELIEVSSSQCSKAILTLSDSSNVYIQCDESTLLRYEDLSGYTSMTSATVGNCVTTLYETFLRKYSLRTVYLSDSITVIGDNSFNQSGITGITIPNSVTSIGNGAFMYCRSLETINLGQPSSIDTYAFYACSGLTNINIPNSVTSIGGDAFQYCTSLTSVTIGDGITSIGNVAFSSCSGLTNITINATIPPTLGNSAFSNTNNCPIYVPYGSVGAYKESWSSYSSRIYPLGYQERWNTLDPSVEYYCDGSVKYYKQQKQWSVDGNTWYNVDPAEYQQGDLIGESDECLSLGKSLNEFIEESTTSYTNSRITIIPNIENIEKIYLDQTKKGGTYNNNCTLSVYSGSSTSNRFTINSFTGISSFIVTINGTETTYNLKSIASDSSYTWVYYNTDNPNEIIIDVHELLGEYGLIRLWLYRFTTAYVTHITQHS